MSRPEKPKTLSNLIFRIFLWVITKINPDLSHRLMNWGLRDGRFRQNTFDPGVECSFVGQNI